MNKLSLRRPTLQRSEFEAKEDFLQMVEWKQQGMTFDEITVALNECRDYFTTESENSKLYYSLIKSYKLNLEVEDAATLERERLLDDIHWVQVQAQRAYTKLKDIDYVEEISGRYQEPSQQECTPEPQVDAFDENGEEDLSTKSKKWSKKKVGLIEQHHGKYLDLILKCIDQRAKLLGIGGEVESKDFHIIELIKSRALDNEEMASVPPLTSEQAVKELYLGVSKEYKIEETLEVKSVDDIITEG